VIEKKMKEMEDSNWVALVNLPMKMVEVDLIVET
jgi:hypothetical protein